MSTTRRLYFVQQCFVTQHQGGFVKKPGRFNVVSVGDDAVWALPVVIEEELQMRCLRVQYAVDEQADEVVQATLQVIVLPYPEQIGVRLQDVQMGIHGLSLVGILVAEAHVGHFFPFAGQRFAISVFLSVEGCAPRCRETDGWHIPMLRCRPWHDGIR